MMSVKRKNLTTNSLNCLIKTDEEPKLDEETKKNFKEIENRVKGVDKMGFKKYFSFEPITLVNKLLGQKTQDLRKSLLEIKQQTIELNKDERNNTNDKNENDRLNNIQSVIDRIYQSYENEFLSDKQPTQSKTEPSSDEDRS